VNDGSTVFSQLLAHGFRFALDSCIARYAGNRRVRRFSCRDQFLAMSVELSTLSDEPVRVVHVYLPWPLFVRLGKRGAVHGAADPHVIEPLGDRAKAGLAVTQALAIRELREARINLRGGSPLHRFCAAPPPASWPSHICDSLEAKHALAPPVLPACRSFHRTRVRSDHRPRSPSGGRQLPGQVAPNSLQGSRDGAAVHVPDQRLHARRAYGGTPLQGSLGDRTLLQVDQASTCESRTSTAARRTR
jgi:hypothetical protein